MTRNLFHTRTSLHPLIRRTHIALVGGVVGLLAVAGLAVSPAVGATATTGIFPDTLQPTVAADPDRGQVELGIRFSPDEPGSVSALKYYQSDKATGVDKATLWSSDGSVLAQASFTPSTTVGWRTIPLNTPVKLTAGKTYVASYNAPHGGYPVSERNLTATKVQNGFTLTPGAGVYRYGPTDQIPTSTFDGSNYLVDVVFAPSNATSTPTPAPVTTPTTSPKPTTTPTPAPTGKGGLVVLGRNFPDSATTGVPAGVTLTPYTGPCAIQTPGTVIDGKQVNCFLRILAKNVVIKNSVINGGVYADFNDNVGSFTITDSRVQAGNGAGTGIGDAYFTATRVEVTGGTRSINCYADCTVKDSYVHGQWNDTSGTNHESGIRMNTNSTLIHNTIACDANDYPPDAGCSAAITGYPDFDPVQNNTIDGNLIIAGSGGYCSYGGSTAGKPFSGQTKNIKYTNNIYQRGTEMGAGGRGYVCGYWGPITSFDVNAPGAVWSNNLYDDGTTVRAAN